MAQVKICGIASRAAYRAAVENHADWVGFQFFPPSPRYVTPAQAQALAIGSERGPPRVGLFVDPTMDAIEVVLASFHLDILQLYTDPATCRAIGARFGLPVWRAVGVRSAADLPTDDEGLDGFIIEPKAPPNASRPGGNAMIMDWSIVHGWQAPAPWLLAGGLTPANVAEAIRISGATAVDVSSGVETAPGAKSAALIHDFIAAARS